MADSELILPDDRRYSRNHAWIKKNGDVYRVGITDYAQSRLGQITHANLPRPEDSFDAEGEFATLESVRVRSPLLMPVAGEIADVNLAVEKEPGLINNDCYGKGWIAEIIPADAASVEKLPDAAGYRKITEG